jgi:hypothetical protein
VVVVDMRGRAGGVLLGSGDRVEGKGMGGGLGLREGDMKVVSLSFVL